MAEEGEVSEMRSAEGLEMIEMPSGDAKLSGSVVR